MRRTQSFLAAAVLAVSLAGGAIAGAPATAQEGEYAYVSMSGWAYHPQSLVVAPGTTVVWTNDEENSFDAHDVVGEDFSWYSPVFSPGEYWAMTFWEPGLYRYLCDLHEGMTGEIIVE